MYDMNTMQWTKLQIDYNQVIEGVFMFCAKCGKELG